MTLDEFIEYADKCVRVSGLTLSDFAKEEITKRWKKKPDQGGYSNYWKEVDKDSVIAVQEIKEKYGKIGAE